MHLSVTFGWGVIIFNLLNWLFSYGSNVDRIGEFIIWAIIILSIRYSAFKPLGTAGTVASGFFALSMWDYLTGQRNAEYSTPIFLGVLAFLLVIFLVEERSFVPTTLSEKHFFLFNITRVKTNKYTITI